MFYGGLSGWELEDVMPARSPGRYFIVDQLTTLIACLRDQPASVDGDARNGPDQAVSPRP